MKKFIRIVAFITVLALCRIGAPAAKAESAFCIEATPAITNATYQYLNDFYIDQHPEMALEYSFGSERDKNTLQKAANEITAGLTDEKAKADAIVKWVGDHIKYVSYHSGEAEYFAIDTYYAQKGNCLGISQLITQLCRLSNVKAVMCGGTRGNMKDVLKLDTRETDHGWVMVHCNGSWALYDPLFSVYGETDRNFIAQWYFTDFIEGVSPYVKAYANYINRGRCIFYIDGRFMHYVEGIPASQFFGNGAEGGFNLNGAVPYFTKNRYKTANGGGDGFHYLENPEKRDQMINDECYAGGWITYGAGMYYAQHNGILAGSTLKNYQGDCYYLTFGSDALKMPGKSTDYTFTRGYPTLMKGESIKAAPLWIDQQVNGEGKVLSWKAETPETVSVSPDGTITALADGYACVSVCSKDSPDSDTHHMFSYLEFWVSSKERTFNPIVDSTKLFKDVKSTAWFKDAVDYAVTHKIFQGTAPNTFDPNSQLTRAQFVTVLANISGVNVSDNSVSSGFKDVPAGKWFTGAVTWAAKNGIVNGVGEGKFAPNAKVTREQMCLMLVNYTENYRKTGLKIVKDAPTFADDAKIAGWAKAAVYKCARAGMVNGVGNNKFDPKSSATRAQGATIFTNFHKEYMN